MYKLRQILLTAFANFRRWKKNPQIILAFCLAFIVSFLLSDKVLLFAKAHDPLLQMAEPFICTVGADHLVTLAFVICRYAEPWK